MQRVLNKDGERDSARRWLFVWWGFPLVFNKMKEENWGVILPLLPAKMGVSLGGRDCGRLSMESIQTQAIIFEVFLKRDSLGKTAGRSLRSGWLMLAESRAPLVGSEIVQSVGN